MDLFEYQGKQYFARFGIPVSPGGVADTVDDAVAVAERAGYPVVVKAQVQVGGRGKAGGIKLASGADEVRTHAGAILIIDASNGRTLGQSPVVSGKFTPGPWGLIRISGVMWTPGCSSACSWST